MVVIHESILFDSIRIYRRKHNSGSALIGACKAQLVTSCIYSNRRPFRRPQFLVKCEINNMSRPIIILNSRLLRQNVYLTEYD